MLEFIERMCILCGSVVSFGLTVSITIISYDWGDTWFFIMESAGACLLPNKAPEKLLTIEN